MTVAELERVRRAGALRQARINALLIAREAEREEAFNYLIKHNQLRK